MAPRIRIKLRKKPAASKPEWEELLEAANAEMEAEMEDDMGGAAATGARAKAKGKVTGKPGMKRPAASEPGETSDALALIKPTKDYGRSGGDDDSDEEPSRYFDKSKQVKLKLLWDQVPEAQQDPIAKSNSKIQ